MEINKAKETSKMLRLSSVFVRKTKSAYCEKCVYEKDVYYFWFVCYFLQGWRFIKDWHRWIAASRVDSKRIIHGL